ncbi:hypothetical protein Taro_019892 [Colocasia esculenta]|uniref:Uncharacterized protein n=1 Tax=Colocasia esculenta TaxID=4460 RepID=A0A843V0J0_COLES|nr:hypothetical protein [Colocasia esculenta]
MRGGFLMPHTLKGRRKSSKIGNQTYQSRNPPFLVIIGLLNTMGRVEELLVAEELWNDHKKPFFFPFSSAATCTNHSLEVDQRARRVSKGSNLVPMTASHRYTVNHGV